MKGTGQAVVGVVGLVVVVVDGGRGFAVVRVVGAEREVDVVRRNGTVRLASVDGVIAEVGSAAGAGTVVTTLGTYSGSGFEMPFGRKGPQSCVRCCLAASTAACEGGCTPAGCVNTSWCSIADCAS